jgi:hypothetical protein
MVVIDSERKFGRTGSGNIKTAPAGISAENWNATPIAVRQLLTLLGAVEYLQHRVAELEERLNQNSRNSSRTNDAATSAMPATRRSLKQPEDTALWSQIPQLG